MLSLVVFAGLCVQTSAKLNDLAWAREMLAEGEKSGLLAEHSEVFMRVMDVQGGWFKRARVR